MPELDGINLVVALAAEFSIETRIRRLLEEHRRAGDEPRTLVMNAKTWHRLVRELDGCVTMTGYFWVPVGSSGSNVAFFHGLPILIKDYVADDQTLVGI